MKASVHRDFVKAWVADAAIASASVNADAPAGVGKSSAAAPHGTATAGRVAGGVVAAAVLFAVALAARAEGGVEVVFHNVHDNGFLVAFGPGDEGLIVHGDSGWLGGPDAPPVALGSITFGLCAFDSPRPGSTDLLVTINDGDPSGLVFGTGAELYNTRVHGLELPATPRGEAVFFSVTVPLPAIQTLGGFNDVGWSVRTTNYSYDGSLGFQVSSALGQVVGFYTNNASFFDGARWSLFAFSDDPIYGVANHVVTIETASPCPQDLDGSGAVNGADIGALLAAWGSGPGLADLDGSGDVDGGDVGLLLSLWGDCPGGK